MGMFAFLMFLPGLLILVTSIVLQGGNLTTNGQNNANFCSANGCVAPGTTTVITCNNGLGQAFAPCKILPGCVNPPAPAWCEPWPISLVAQGTYLNAGATVILTSSQVNSAVSASSALFQFGSIGINGFTVMIIVVVGIVCLASITVFSTGMGGEGVHILAVSGMVLGIWIILSSIDGFITGNPHSIFAYLNQIPLDGFAVGTFLYILCSFLWTFGWLSAFTRGV